jgi:hypothetical protein
MKYENVYRAVSIVERIEEIKSTLTKIDDAGLRIQVIVRPSETRSIMSVFNETFDLSKEDPTGLVASNIKPLMLSIKAKLQEELKALEEEYQQL